MAFQAATIGMALLVACAVFTLSGGFDRDDWLN